MGAMLDLKSHSPASLKLKWHDEADRIPDSIMLLLPEFRRLSPCFEQEYLPLCRGLPCLPLLTRTKNKEAEAEYLAFKQLFGIGGALSGSKSRCSARNSVGETARGGPGAERPKKNTNFILVLARFSSAERHFTRRAALQVHTHFIAHTAHHCA
jgi:hypothetical protein